VGIFVSLAHPRLRALTHAPAPAALPAEAAVPKIND